MSLNPARPCAAIMLILALAGVYVGAGSCMQNLAYTRVQTEISFWGRGAYQPTLQVIHDTGQNLQALLQEAPRHPENLALQAYFTAWQAYWSKDPSTRDALNREAVEIQYLALLSRPAHPQGWLKMVEYASRASRAERMLQLAQNRLESLQPLGN